MSRRRKIKPMTLDQLDHWRRHEADLSWNNISLSELDGFLAALIVGPTFTPPELWMRAIFGMTIPGAYGEPKGEAAIQAIVEHHNNISTTLAERPENYAQQSQTEDWAVGGRLGLGPGVKVTFELGGTVKGMLTRSELYLGKVRRAI